MGRRMTNAELGAELIRLADAAVNLFGERTNLLSISVRILGIRIYTHNGRYIEPGYAHSRRALSGPFGEVITVYEVPDELSHNGHSGAYEAAKLFQGKITVVRKRALRVLKRLQKLLPLEAIASV
jgi:hypothetical protein